MFCDVTATGDVTSFEVCPSKVRVTRRLSYSELDDMLAREETTGRLLESLLADSSGATGGSDTIPAQSPNEGRMSTSLRLLCLQLYWSHWLPSLIYMFSSPRPQTPS